QFVQPKELRQICETRNNRPRKKLGYLTPKEVFFGESNIEKLTDDP
ncbi:MAG: IS30 family transposase, partial [Bacteroidetes bacterium HLUCCA01]